MIRKNNIKFYILISLGISVIALYFWGRFIRQRLPRDIPFDLTLWSLIVLIIILISFIITIKYLLKPKISILYPILYPTLLKIYKPIYVLNDFIKDNKYLKHTILKIAQNLTCISFLYGNTYYMFYLIFYILPKFILLTLFYLDIFYFHKFNLFYNFIFLSIIPLTISYIFYLMQNTLEHYTNYLEERYEAEILSTNPNPEFDYADCLTEEDYLIRRFLNQQNANSILFKYKCSIGWGIVRERYPEITSLTDLTMDQKLLVENHFYDIMPGVINMSCLSNHYEYVLKHYSWELKWIHIILYLLYLFGWLYIIFISIETFHFTSLDIRFLINFCETRDPFSEIPL
jgi:hypothetical protein